MRKINAYITSVISILLVSASMSASAEEFKGRIVNIDGDVYVLDSKGKERKPEKSQFLVRNDETVVTKKGSRAVVQFNDGALTVLNEKSSVRVEQSGWFSHLGGKVYYLFRKVLGKEKPKKVKTGFTTIGIRGTTFIVTDDHSGQHVALQEGKINVESLDDDYEIHKPKADDFESFKQQMKDRQEALHKEYTSYKQQLKKEFVEYKKSFDLEANNMLSFSGNRVDQSELSSTVIEEFDEFSNYAKDYVDAFQELDEEVKK